MNIGLINGSIRSRGVSASLLEEVKLLFDGEDISSFHWKSREEALTSADTFIESNALVLFFGVYFDGVPSHLLGCMEELEKVISSWKEKPSLYAVINCGYYEVSNTDLSFEILRHWCGRLGIPFKGGIAFGSAGGYLAYRRIAMGEGPKEKLSLVLHDLVSAVKEEREIGIASVDLGMSREEYFVDGNKGWDIIAKRQGLSKEDLLRAPSFQQDKH